MSKQYHFVVVVNEDGTFDFDFDVSLNFDSGEVWDTETEEWSYAVDDIDPYDNALDLLRKQLAK